jgi:hypothetical protein
MAYLQGFDTRELEKWQRDFLKLRNQKTDAAKSRIMRKAGLRGLEVTLDNTPRDFGRLQNSMTVGDPENVFLVRVTKLNSIVLLGTSVYYAVFVKTVSSSVKVNLFLESLKIIPGKQFSGMNLGQKQELY